MSTVVVDRTLDAKGLMCPMPLVKARQAILELQVGQVLQVLATDRGSVKDFQGWAKVARNIELIDQAQEEEAGKTVFIHYVRRTK